MEKVKRRVLHIAVATIIACVVFVVAVVYIALLDGVVHTNTVQMISEMVKHDRNAINTYINHNWDFLDRMGQRLHRKEYRYIQDIQEYILQEREESSFDYVYLVGEDGTAYTDTFLFLDKEEYDFSAHFIRNEEVLSNTVFHYDWVGENEEEEYLVYGINVSALRDVNGENFGDLVVSGKKMSFLLGFTKVSSIQDGLVIDIFHKGNSPRGYSAVVDKSGNFIVDAYRTGYLNQTRNLFTYIENCDQSDFTKEQVAEKMSASETFSFYRTDREDGDPVRRFAYCTPFEDNGIEWYFIMSVNEAVFDEWSSSLITLNIIELVIVLLIVVVALLFVMITQNRAVKALAKERAQSEFLSNMSHEIRTPLNGLVGLNYLVLQSINDPEKAEQIKEWLAKSHSTANYLLSLVNDVLDMSKLQAGKVELTHEPLLLETVMDAIWSMQRDNIESRGVRFITDIDIKAPCVYGDEVRIKQVLMNIVGNAAKFTPRGGFIKLSLHQKIIDDKRVATTFVCEDSGCGMSKEFLKKIFDSFSQERNRNSNSVKGTGLGMAISKLLVDAMGGQIVVESELEKGSKFTVTIPAEISEMPDYMQYSDGRDMSLPITKQKDTNRPTRVLVAEDNELNAEILLEILGEAGFVASHVNNGSEAVQMFSDSELNEYDIILMDMRMPIMDGCAASKAIRELDREDAKTVPIFACTANTFEEDRVRAMQSGMNDFLTKPIDVKVFLQKMEAISLKKHSGN